MAQAPLPRAVSGLLLLILTLVLSSNMQADPPPIPLATFRSQLLAAGTIVTGCRLQAWACKSHNLPEDAEVAAQPGVPGFHARWQWLQDAIDQAAKAPATERRTAMDAASAHLAELTTQISPGNPTTRAGAQMTAARAAAARVLAGNEFRADAAPTWLDRALARLQEVLLRLLFGMGRVGARNPWIAPLIEWLCFGLAAAGLLFFLRRSLGRQALRISLAGSAPTAAVAGRSPADWLADADAAEAAGRGREAIHCLYWAAIASLETRRAWRPNPTRTPREYLRLLRPGSAAQNALRDLTRNFERSWYGDTQPGTAEIQAARQNLLVLQTGALDRAAAANQSDRAFTPPASLTDPTSSVLSAGSPR